MLALHCCCDDKSRDSAAVVRVTRNTAECISSRSHVCGTLRLHVRLQHILFSVRPGLRCTSPLPCFVPSHLLWLFQASQT